MSTTKKEIDDAFQEFATAMKALVQAQEAVLKARDKYLDALYQGEGRK